MSSIISQLDPARIRALFDLRSSYNAHSGGGYEDDPHPAFHRLRETGPVHKGTVHELIGYAGPAAFHGLPFPERPHYSAFSFEICDQAFRDQDTFSTMTKLPLIKHMHKLLENHPEFRNQNPS